MKSKLIFNVTVIAALVIGFFVGRFQAGKAWSTFFEQYVFTDASNQAHFWVRALTSLQDGQQSKAAEFMEARLDGALITFIAFESVLPEERNEAGVRAIRVAREYRSKHPWQSTSPEIQDAVQRVLSLNK